MSATRSEEVMSRIHAFVIAILITGVVAVGTTTAFTVAGGGGAGQALSPELSTEALQARADKINETEKKLADGLRRNPPVDRSPIVKTIAVPASGGSGSSYASGPSTSSGSSSVRRHDDDRDDDHGGDDDDHDDDDHGEDD
jgi:hypothetical protein